MKNEHEQHKEMEEILKAELDREAWEILAEIEADESLQDLTMPDEAEEELMQKIQKLEEKKAAYELLSEKDKEALRIGREIQMQKENKVESDETTTGATSEDGSGKVVAFRKKRKRTYVLVAVVAALVLMMGMTSMGEVPLVTRITEQLLGNKGLTNVDSERENENSVEEIVDENAKAYEEIKDAFKVDIIKLDYRPDKTEILDYEIDEVLNRATIIYQCGESIMEYQMIFNYRNQVSGYMIEDELINEETYVVDDILIQLQRYKVEDSEEVMYIAQFAYQDVYYTFNVTTLLSEEEIEKILKNIKKF